MAFLVTWLLLHRMGVTRGASSSDFTLSHVMLTPLKGGSFPSENLACEKKTDFCSKNWTGLGLAPVVPLASLPLPPLRSLECSYGCWRIVQEVLSQDSAWQAVNTPGQRGWYFYVHRKCFAIYVTVHQFPLLSPTYPVCPWKLAPWGPLSA